MYGISRSQSIGATHGTHGARRWAVAALAAVLSLWSTPAVAERWVGADKALHLAVSFALGGGAYTTLALAGDDPQLVKLAIAVPVAMLPGLAKELHDAGQPGNRFSSADLLWDLIGAVTGAVVALVVERCLFPRRARRPSSSRTAGSRAGGG